MQRLVGSRDSIVRGSFFFSCFFLVLKRKDADDTSASVSELEESYESFAPPFDLVAFEQQRVG